MRREGGASPVSGERIKTGIPDLDALLGQGILRGTSVAVSGVPGGGKTTILTEFLYRGATVCQEKGLYITFDESVDQFIAMGESKGWDLAKEIKSGMIEILDFRPAEILVDSCLQKIYETVKAKGFSRIALDSLSDLLHKVKDDQVIREKVQQIIAIVQSAQAVAFIATEQAMGSRPSTHAGVEETTVQGIILLSNVREGKERKRYLEVYKMRNTEHATGEFPLLLTRDGIQIVRNGT